MVYSIIAVLLTANSFFVQPWRAWNALGSDATPNFNFLHKSWWPNTVMELTAIKRKNSAKFPQLNEVLRSFAFWGECFWFSSQLFLLTYYLSTINQILFALGDASANTADVDSLYNNMFTRACVFFNGLGWLWSPFVGYLMVTRSVYFRVYLEIIMALAMSLMLTVPIIEVQVVVFLIQALVRLQLFSNHFAYLGERFGFRHFGLLNGISSLVAGAVGLLGYFLQIYSLFVANGNYGLSYFFVSAFVVSSCVFPFILRRKDRTEVESDDTEAVVDDSEREPNEEGSDKELQGKIFGHGDALTADSSYDVFFGLVYSIDPSCLVKDSSYDAFLEYLYSSPKGAKLDRKETIITESTFTDDEAQIVIIDLDEIAIHGVTRPRIEGGESLVTKSRRPQRRTFDQHDAVVESCSHRRATTGTLPRLTGDRRGLERESKQRSIWNVATFMEYD